MIEWLTELTQPFHFIRPWWLVGIPVSFVAILWLWRRQAATSDWQQLINPELLRHLIHGKPQRSSRIPLLGLAAIWILTCVALAGPSWEKLPQPIHKSEQALVVMLDLSPSMLAQDLKPSRLVRARLKLIDFLSQRQEGLTALIAFAGESYVITPLTDDTRTITALVPSLSPNIMPLAGSNPEMAVQQAVALLDEAGIANAELLLITDGIDSNAIATIEKTIDAKHRLSILGVGTTTGAPIPISSGGFAKDKNGGMVLARLNSAELQRMSQSQRGNYRTLSATNDDIQALAQSPNVLDDNHTREINREFDLWLDRGPWLALLLLPLLLLGFRRGWLLTVVITVSMVTVLPNPQPAMAFEWQDLWQTGDQQGQTLLQSGDASAAAQKFKDPDWAGSAHYQASEYEDAIADFAKQDTATAHYNRGNALAKSGRLEEALEAYEQALEKDPDFADAKYNQQLVEQAQQQQQQDQSGEQGDSDQQDQQQGQQQGQQQNQQQDQQGQQQNQGDEQQSQSGKQNRSEQQSDSENGSENDQQKTASDTEQSQQPGQQTEQQNDQVAEQHTAPQQSDPQEAENGDPSQAGTGEVIDEPELTPEQKEQLQAMEQWLRKVPDDPSGLMRKKFQHQYNQRRLQYQKGTWEPPENNALERW